MGNVSYPNLNGISTELTFKTDVKLNNNENNRLDSNKIIQAPSFEANDYNSETGITKYEKDLIETENLLIKSNTLLAKTTSGGQYNPTESASLTTKKYVDDRLPFYYKDTQPKTEENDYIVRIHTTTRS